MQYLTAIFLPPLYFLMRGKILAFILSTVCFIVSIVLLMTIVFAPGALILWLLCVVPASMDIRKRMMQDHASLTAKKMAEEMSKLQK